MLSQSPEVSLYDLSSLKMLVTGSSLLSSTIRVEVMDRIPSLRYVRESYGLNECGLVTLTYPRDAKKSSASSSSAGGELKNNQTKFHHIHGTLKLLLAIDKVRPQGFFFTPLTHPPSCFKILRILFVRCILMALDYHRKPRMHQRFMARFGQ